MSFGDEDNSSKRIKLDNDNGEPIKEDIFTTDHKVSRQRRAKTLDGAGKFRGCVVWFTGYSGAGKSTVAMGVEEQLVSRGNLISQKIVFIRYFEDFFRTCVNLHVF